MVPFNLEDAASWLWAGGAGVMGRAMYHAHLIQQGKRKSILWIVCDLFIALGMGWIVLGLSDWVGLTFKVSQSLAIVAAWAGPQLIDQIISRSMNKYLGKDDTPTGLGEP